MSGPETLPRLASQHLAALVGTMKVAVVTGARQVGKSTLVQSSPALEGYTYLTLDNLDLRQQAREAPRALLTRADRVIVDEIQQEPDLLPVIKHLVDQAPPGQRGRFVLTGSANLLGLRRVGESLAGRAGYTTLWPLTRRELLGAGRAGLWTELHASPPSTWQDMLLAERALPAEWSTAVVRGGYPVPAVHLPETAQRELWYQGYIDTYLHRDVPDVSAISSSLDLHRLMKRVVLDIGQLEHQARWATELGLSRPTVGRWLDLLEVSYQLARLPAWTLNRRKQLVKARKIYWADAGLACALAGVRDPTGAHLENLVLTDLRVWQGAESRRPGIYHWRTRDGNEVDLVVEYADGTVLPIEVKATDSVALRDARGLSQFLVEYPEAQAGLLLYSGADVFWLTNSVLAAPWWRVV